MESVKEFLAYAINLDKTRRRPASDSSPMPWMRAAIARLERCFAGCRTIRDPIWLMRAPDPDFEIYPR